MSVLCNRILSNFPYTKQVCKKIENQSPRSLNLEKLTSMGQNEGTLNHPPDRKNEVRIPGKRRMKLFV